MCVQQFRLELYHLALQVLVLLQELRVRGAQAEDLVDDRVRGLEAGVLILITLNSLRRVPGAEGLVDGRFSGVRVQDLGGRHISGRLGARTAPSARALQLVGGDGEEVLEDLAGGLRGRAWSGSKFSQKWSPRAWRAPMENAGARGSQVCSAPAME